MPEQIPLIPSKSKLLICSDFANPPEIINGTLQMCLELLIRSMSKPFFVPSFSMEFKITSPAPKSITFFIQCLTSMLVLLVPL